MASMDASVAIPYVEGVSDRTRARELYKYYQPSASIPTDAVGQPLVEDGRDPEHQSRSHISSSKVSSPDTALTAFAQLVSWRTGAQRAMISLIDEATQYFVAESTKTVDLVDSDRYAPGDELWIGCSSVSKAGRLCERTISVAPKETGEYPSFIIDDLTKDDRFDKLPFVTSHPFLKFYAGVPLITKRGIPIGSLFIVDDRVRQGLRKDDIHFMGTMALTIMRHLEMVREVEEHRRGMKMSRGLASFVEGRAELAEAELDAEDGQVSKIVGQFETDSAIVRTKSRSGSTRESAPPGVGSGGNSERKRKEGSSVSVKADEMPLPSNDLSEAQNAPPELGPLSQATSFDGISMSLSSAMAEPLDKSAFTPGTETSEASALDILFSRAANLIREAFEVDGGAVFYDAQRGFNLEKHQESDDSHVSNDDLQSPSDHHSDHGGSPLPGIRDTSFSSTSNDPGKMVEILGFSTADASSIHGDEYPGPQSFIPFQEKALQGLLRRFPYGKLWTLDSDGSVSSSSEEEGLLREYRIGRSKSFNNRKQRHTRSSLEAAFILKHFPGVRQLLFVPLWDAGRTRWQSGCFAWSTEPTRILSKHSELAFLSAFGNSVMAECSRIDTEIADQKKGDFIGSVSHELRSPLHGILASAEFLSDEVSTGFGKGLVETIDSCGRTLLDTINHILDFSKINHFEINWRKNRRSGTRPTPHSKSSASALRRSDLPMINLFASLDVSLVCEEVVESVFAGHVFQNLTAYSFDQVPDARGKMSDPKNFIQSSDPLGEPERPRNQEVAVILDADIQNYHFTTQPGAFRRIIMNLLGNALKYTSHGYVRITLDATEMEDLHTTGTSETIPRSMVVLTVTDTGKGISSEFLRSKLFTPFAQENSLSSGTGLGLSIVRSIVTLLEGEITINSELGRGTQVRVALPLLREMPQQPESSANTPKSVSSLPREADESIDNLRAQVSGKSVSLHGFDIDARDPVIHQMGQLLKASVTNFLTNWYGLQVVPFGQNVDIIIANEASEVTISKLSEHVSGQGRIPSILILCSHSSRFDRSMSQEYSKGNLNFVAKPVGPLKLAKALIQCIQTSPANATADSLQPSTAVEDIDLINVFEELSLHPHGGEVLDNSRMAADSDNARKVIESPTPNALSEKRKEFPFPIPEKTLIPQNHGIGSDAQESEPRTVVDHEASSFVIVAGMDTTPENVEEISSPPSRKTHSPRLLLVDDNIINLKLLGTYMRKRNYEIIDEAENGLEAVKRVQDRDEGYDIIFMDISMPVLDGFGATRQIRAIEESRKKRGLQESKIPGSVSRAETEPEAEALQGTQRSGLSVITPALVIALTGLASTRDQSEAFKSGIDLFLTKPVSLKEVGKMLDNWEANRDRDDVGVAGAG